MKVDLIKKYKWYILGLIIAWILMAVGLSFCAWDNKSILKNINGNTANYKIFAEEWMAKNVGEDFTDTTGLRWLVVDKKTQNETTDMVLMTYNVTEKRVYGAHSTPDYNHGDNNVREYLNTSWYPKIGKELRILTVPKVTAYQEGTIFPNQQHPELPVIYPVAPTSNYAWLPSENEVGFIVDVYGDAGKYIHDKKLEYFNSTNVYWKITNDFYLGDNARRIAYNNLGEAVAWFTRTGKLSHMVTTVSELGGLCIDRRHWSTSESWLRPCIQVRF